MDVSIRREQILVKTGTVVQGARYIHGDKPLASMENVKGNYDLHFANVLSSYLCITTYINTRANQWQCHKLQLALVSGQRKNRPRQKLNNYINVVCYEVLPCLSDLMHLLLLLV